MVICILLHNFFVCVQYSHTPQPYHKMLLFRQIYVKRILFAQ